jgi:hypothetical protein
MKAILLNSVGVSWCALLLSSKNHGISGQRPPNEDSRGIEYPTFRYVQYRYLDRVTMAQASTLGYSEATWDRPGTNSVERIGFADQGLGQEVLTQMGFTEEVWDCYVNHYLYYEWADLVDLGVQEYMINLGWTEEIWGDPFDNPIYDLFWEELTDEQRGNATEICYFEQIWDRSSLQSWTTGPPTDPPSPAPSAPTSSTTSAPSSPTTTTLAPTPLEEGSGAMAGRSSMRIATPMAGGFLTLGGILVGFGL